MSKLSLSPKSSPLRHLALCCTWSCSLGKQVLSSIPKSSFSLDLNYVIFGF